MNLLNEEIRVIQNMMAHIKRAMPLAENGGERLRLKERYDELETILQGKLELCEDYKG